MLKILLDAVSHSSIDLLHGIYGQHRFLLRVMPPSLTQSEESSKIVSQNVAIHNFLLDRVIFSSGEVLDMENPKVSKCYSAFYVWK